MSSGMFFVICLLRLSVSWAVFPDVSFNEVNERMAKLSPIYSSVKSAHDLYLIDYAREGKEFCSPMIARISHMATLDADLSRPQALISGEIHGDERIGPSAALVTVEILILASECTIDKKESSCAILKDMYDITDQRTLVWLTVLATRRDTYVIPTTNCLGHMHHQRAELGIDTNRDFPYGRADSRCLRTKTAQVINSVMKNNLIQMVITFHGGMAAIGYEWGSLNHRSPKDDCPDSMAHSEIAEYMKLMAGGWSSAEKDSKLYPVGKMNSIVYPVDGGLEDWVYASGWDTKGVQNHLCDGFSYFHPTVRNKEKESNMDVVFTDMKNPHVQATGNRAVVFLVETSDMKKPSPATWGMESHLLSRGSRSNGHVPRNIRLNLVGLDMLQPYLCVEEVGFRTTAGLAVDSAAEQSVVRHTESSQDKCSPTVDTTISTVADVTVSWSVNGVASVDATWLSILVNPLPSEDIVNKIIKQNMYSKLQHYLNGEHGTKGAPSSSSSTTGTTTSSSGADSSTYEIPLTYSLHMGDKGRWADTSVDFAAVKAFTHHLHIKPLVVDADCSSSTFTTGVGQNEDDIIYLPLGVHWIVPYASVDGAMGKDGQGFPKTEEEKPDSPAMRPQSHLSNARTNRAWHSVLATGDVDAVTGEVHAKKEREVVGFAHWAAEPIVIHVFNEPGGRGMGVEQLSSTVQCAWWDAASSGKSVPSSSKMLYEELLSEELNLIDTDTEHVKPPMVIKPQDSTPKPKPKSDSSGFFVVLYGISLLSLIGIIRILISRVLGGRQFYGSSNSSSIKEMKPNLGIYKSGNKNRSTHVYEMVSTRDEDR